MGSIVEFGMGSILRRHPMAEKGRQLLADAGHDTAVSDARIVIDHLEVARKLGSPILRCVAGNLFARDEGYDMVATADEVVAILREACRAAEVMGMKIAMENHADFTVRELASIHARVNSPAFGFTVDCANLAFDLDNPLRLAEILAPHALTTHFKDYRIIRTHEGLALQNGALGDGDIDLPAIAATLANYNPDDQSESSKSTRNSPRSSSTSSTRTIGLAILRRRLTVWRGTWRRHGTETCCVRGPRTCPMGRKRGSAKPKMSDRPSPGCGDKLAHLLTP